MCERIFSWRAWNAQKASQEYINQKRGCAIIPIGHAFPVAATRACHQLQSATRHSGSCGFISQFPSSLKALSCIPAANTAHRPPNLSLNSSVRLPKTHTIAQLHVLLAQYDATARAKPPCVRCPLHNSKRRLPSLDETV